jgi:hypothetical protein
MSSLVRNVLAELHMDAQIGHARLAMVELYVQLELARRDYGASAANLTVGSDRKLEWWGNLYERRSDWVRTTILVWTLLPEAGLMAADAHGLAQDLAVKAIARYHEHWDNSKHRNISLTCICGHKS